MDQRERRHPAFVKYDAFDVKVDALHFQSHHRVDDARITTRPISAVPGCAPDVGKHEPQDASITVVWQSARPLSRGTALFAICERLSACFRCDASSLRGPAGPSKK